MMYIGVGTYVGGKYCEHKVATVKELRSNTFEECPCLNNGHCYSRNGFSQICTCPDGFKGRFCEYENEKVPDCDLDCDNGGYCIFTSIDGFAKACFCPDGYEGTYCEVRAVPCGESVCYNGASCISEHIFDGIPVDYCDCRTAVTAGGKRHDGVECQYKETSRCDTANDTENRLFCVNNGQCKDDGVMGCVCPDGYKGFSCEFFTGDPTLGGGDNGKQGKDGGGDNVVLPQIDDMPDCSLECGEHGTCRHGLKDTSNLGDVVHAGDLSKNHENLQHCVCEKGFVGLNCDKAINICDDDLFCMHGAECRKDSLDSFYCDCSSTEGDNQYYGRSCEFVISSICTVTSGHQGHFCVNGGRCKRLSMDHEE